MAKVASNGLPWVELGMNTLMFFSVSEKKVVLEGEKADLGRIRALLLSFSIFSNLDELQRLNPQLNFQSFVSRELVIDHIEESKCWTSSSQPNRVVHKACSSAFSLA